MIHKQFFFKILDILEANNIPYCLFAGTLLGAIRDEDFLPSDTKDTDIAIDESYYWEVRYLMNKYILNKEFKWYAILRKELTVCNNSNSIKVDMFFMETIRDSYYMYCYKPNEINHRWNHEWRMSFPKFAFYPLKTIEFLDRPVSIPNNYSLLLTMQYGNWKIPDPDWVTSDKNVLNVDKDYNGFFPAGITDIDNYKIDETNYNIGFIVINFLRTEATKKCILSLREHYPNIKIYLADQDEPSSEMIQFYEKNYVEYYYVPYDCGIGYCRNFLVTKVREPFLLWGDNDFVFTKNSNIEHGITILSNNDDIGFVGGGVINNNKLGHYERILDYNSTYGILVYIPLELTNPPKYIIDNINYYYCDLTYNYVIGKTKILQDNEKLRWDIRLKVAYEHTSLFLCLKQFSEYRVVYCPSMVINHEHSFSNQTYNDLRNRKNAGEIFGNIWNLRMNFTIGQGREIYIGRQLAQEGEIANKILPIELPKGEPENLNAINSDKQITIISNPIKDSEPQISNITAEAIEKSPVKDILNYLITTKTEFWLLKDSCYQAVIKNNLDFEKLQIGVRTLETKQKLDALNFGNLLEVTVESNRKTKKHIFNDISIYVPMPVILYLQKYTNKSWKTLQNEK